MTSRFAGIAGVRSLCCALALMLASGPALAQTAVAPSAPSQTLKDRLEKIPAVDELVGEREALKTFYAAREFTPIWFDQNGPTRAASLVIKEISQAASWGLRAQDFALPVITKGSWPRTAAEVAEADYELSSAILKYARDASGGRIAEPERRLSDFLDRRPDLPDPSAVLAAITAAADPSAVLLSYHPQHEQFQRLHDLYVKLTGNAQEAVTPQLNREGPMLVPGTKGPEIATLRQRLGVKVPEDGAADVYDADLADAVKTFQKTNRLSADGLVGPKTRQALLKKESGGSQLAAIVATMEQWRWMPRDLGKRHILVNIPAFAIDFVEDGKTQMTERVIVGKPQTPTPVFSKAMTRVVLKPTWSLPDSIKREKLLSAIRRGGSLEGEGLVVKKGNRTINSWSVDWERANLSHYTIYQPSGDGNALGNVKFLFPNKFSVYLHDTPNKSLFEAEERAFSHGCIRLRNPLKVAQFVLDWDRGSGEVDVKRLASRGPSNNDIALETPIPMHVGYFNVWVADDGQVETFGDPYGHMERVNLALAGKWDAIDKGPRHDTTANPGLYADSSANGDGDAKPAKLRRTLMDADGNPVFAPPMGLLTAPAAKPVPAPAVQMSETKPKHKAGYVSELMNSAFAR